MCLCLLIFVRVLFGVVLGGRRGGRVGVGGLGVGSGWWGGGGVKFAWVVLSFVCF